MTRKPPGDTNDRNPKYLNSPESEVFHKRVLPFGLNPAAVAALRGGADVVLVEGPMDAMAVNTATDHHGLVAVATGGTALTAQHLATLNAIAPLADRQVLVVMDNDPAGDTAAVAARTVLTKAGVQHPMTITPMPVKDASQLLQEQGPDALRAAMADRRPLEDLVIDRIEKIHAAQWPRDVGRIESRINVLDSAAPHVAAMSADQQHRQALRLVEKLNLSPFTVLDHLDQHRPTAAPRTPAPPGDLGLPTPPVLHTRTAEPAQPEPTAAHQPEQSAPVALLDHPIPTPAVPPAAPGQSPADTETILVEPAEQAEPARKYQDLPDPDLAAAATQANREQQQATQAAAEAQAEALATAEAVTAGHGPATEQLEQDTARHEQHLVDVTTFKAQLQSLREVETQLRQAAGELSDAKRELAGLGRLAGRRKAELADRIQQIQTAQAARLQHITATADAVAPLQDRLGASPRQAQQRIDAARAHLAARPELHAQAVEQDRQLADHTAQQAETLTTAAEHAADLAARYAAELQHRADHPEAAVADQPRTQPSLPGRQATDVGIEDHEYNPALDWTYRPEIHDLPPAPDHSIEP